MFGIGMSEMVLIMGVALLVFGPEKLPEVAKTIAKGLRELRKATDDLRSTVMVDFDDDKPTRRATFADPAAVTVTPAAVLTTGSGPSDHDGLTAAGSAPASLAAAPLAVPLPTAVPADVVADDRTETWPRTAEGAVARGAFNNERVLDGSGADVSLSPTVGVALSTSANADTSSGEAMSSAPHARDEER